MPRTAFVCIVFSCSGYTF